MMNTETKILVVEHDASDIELLEYELKKGGMNYLLQIVQNEQEYANAISHFNPDVILCDYSLPLFDGPTAFKIRQDLAPGTPFIFVSGNIGEENSIEYIRNGVTDYALKDKLFTLTTKIQRALKEAKEEQQKNKTEQERIQNEKRLARAQQIAHMGSWELDIANNIVVWSDEMCRIYGFPGHENHQSFNTWLSFIHPEDYEYVSDRIKEYQGSHTNFSFYHRIILRNGVTKHIYSESKLEFNSSGNPARLYVIAHDVTEIKLAEEQREFDKNNLNALINNTSDLMWSVDKDFKLITSNKTFDELIRASSGKSISKGSDILSTRFSEEQLSRFKGFYERSFKGETFTAIEYGNIPVETWLEISFSPIRKGNEIIGTACYAHEITARKLAELERARITDDLIQRNKELEQFTYIISHNLRAPVANIIGAVSGLDNSGLSTKNKDVLSQGLKESATKLDGIIKDLNYILQVKQEINEIKEKVLFSRLVDDIKLSINNITNTDDINIAYDFSAVNEYVTIKSYLHSIFFNLIFNSIKYRRQQMQAIIGIKSHLIKNTIELIFSDNGMGIDLQKRGEQVFGLYKRFHTNIEGKGMGLFMVKTQVETLGGRISIKSKVNKGTEFKIEFLK